MKSSNKQKQTGFTIIELLIATAVFSVVLLVFLTAFLRISQLFYKGINLSKTQEVARTVTNDIGNDIQFYNIQPNPGTVANGYFCVGEHRYAFNLHQQVGASGTAYGIARQAVPASGCPNLASKIVPNPCTGQCQELLDDGMQINDMKLTCGGGLCNVTVHIVFYGNDPTVLYDPANPAAPNGWQATGAECKGALSDSQYCATATYATTVLQSF